MEKYRRVLKDRSEVAPKEEIRVTASGRPFSYVNYAEKLFKTEEQKSITIRATGMAIATAILVAEVSKRRFDGLHQITTVGVTDIVDEYAPIEDGLDTIQETRSVPFISIVLAKEVTEEDKLKVGYQPPVDQSLVKTVEMDQLRSAPGRLPRREALERLPQRLQPDLLSRAGPLGHPEPHGGFSIFVARGCWAACN
eukprot:Polyplicarium_translucidae@DN1501_c0_g1_i1.p1